jgi:NAD(P)H-dependent FMN reductase
MQDTPLRIAVLAGTTREQRKSIHAARFIASVGERLDGVEIRFADPADFTFHGDGNDPEGKDPRYTELTEWADGFFIIVPEYNHGYPGSLKRMLDSELKNYIHKPVAFAGCSSGRWGGVRAIEALVNAVREMGLVACFTDVQFPKVQDIFSESGELLEPVYKELVKKAYAELLWMAQALKHGRTSIATVELT